LFVFSTFTLYVNNRRPPQVPQPSKKHNGAKMLVTIITVPERLKYVI